MIHNVLGGTRDITCQAAQGYSAILELTYPTASAISLVRSLRLLKIQQKIRKILGSNSFISIRLYC
jgi:hypothetical protein